MRAEFYRCYHRGCDQVVRNDDGDLHWAQAGMILPVADPEEFKHYYPRSNAHTPVFCSDACEGEARVHESARVLRGEKRVR